MSKPLDIGYDYGYRYGGKFHAIELGSEYKSEGGDRFANVWVTEGKHYDCFDIHAAANEIISDEVLVTGDAFVVYWTGGFRIFTVNGYGKATNYGFPGIKISD